MNREMPALLFAAVLVCAVGTTASAHPKLQVSDPQAGATVTEAVNAVTMSFSEAVVLKFSGVSIQNEAKKAIPTLSAALDPNDKKKLVIRLKSALQPGTYEVNWHAVSADTHRVEGHFSFIVGR